MKFFGIQDARVHKACAKFCYQMTCEELSQKKTKIVYFLQVFSETNFVIFSTSSYNVQTQKKIAHTFHT
mgnify:CR=1 FL=1